MGKRAVITGGAGFLGSHLAERLLDENIEVVCVDNFITGSRNNIKHLLGHPGFQFVEADVTEHISITGPVDYVLHFASPASPVDYAELPIETLKVGSLGTLNTLGLAKAKGARYLLASTSETYGDPLVHPQVETYWGNVNPVGPRACYDEAKRFAEATTVSYRTHHGVDTAIMRIFNTYGPRMRPNDGRAIPNFVRQALDGDPVTVAGDGSQTRSVCYVDDLIDGAFRLLLSDLPGPVNIGNPHEMSVLELARAVREAAGSPSEIVFVDRPIDDPSVRRPDITVAQTELGWAPQVPLADGLARTIDYFRELPAAAGTARVPAARQASEEVTRFKVAVVGTGYVGAVTSTCLAWLGHDVYGLDSNSTQASQLNRGQVPFYEPGLSALMTETLATGRLQFTDQAAEALTGADFIFLCVGTPTTANGTPDLRQIESAIRSIAPFVGPETIVINKSTVPVGSGNWAKTLLEESLPRNRRHGFRVVSNPEFLREGSAIDDFLRPDRVVLGGEESAVARAAQLYHRVLQQSFPHSRRSRKPLLITTELASAEMIKYAANAFLATKISFANEMANLCELVGADARQVLPAIGADHRIGAEFLAPGLGWGGSCFGKDVAALVATGQEYGYGSALLRAAVDVNQLQRAGAVRKLQRELRVIKGRRIAVLGLAFKPGTDDLRDAPALDVARRLVTAGCLVSAYDPVVKRLPDDLNTVRVAADVYDAADRADAVVLATDWADFAKISPDLLGQAMTGSLVLDGRNLLDPDEFVAAGLRVEGFGW